MGMTYIVVFFVTLSSLLSAVCSQTLLCEFGGGMFRIKHPLSGVPIYPTSQSHQSEQKYDYIQTSIWEVFGFRTGLTPQGISTFIQRNENIWEEYHDTDLFATFFEKRRSNQKRAVLLFDPTRELWVQIVSTARRNSDAMALWMEGKQVKTLASQAWNHLANGEWILTPDVKI